MSDNRRTLYDVDGVTVDVGLSDPIPSLDLGHTVSANVVVRLDGGKLADTTFDVAADTASQAWGSLALRRGVRDALDMPSGNGPHAIPAVKAAYEWASAQLDRAGEV